VKRRRNRAASQARWEFELPVPDVSHIGNYQRGVISDRDRATINRTLPPEIDREKLWAQLQPVIRETRSLEAIVAALESTIRALQISVRTLSERNDGTTALAVQVHVTELREALRYYKQLRRRPRARERLSKIRVLRAWVAASGKKPTISTPDNADREEGERRGRGTPGGQVIDYLQAAFPIICNSRLSPEGIKKFLYRNYYAHSYFQYAHARLSGSSALVERSGQSNKN
jgi:hypothetical protein